MFDVTEGIKLKDVKGYNPKYHDNHGKGWTTEEIEYVKTSQETLVAMSLFLGRSANTICGKRIYLRKSIGDQK